jgi:hypothetical protein
MMFIVVIIAIDPSSNNINNNNASTPDNINCYDLKRFFFCWVASRPLTSSYLLYAITDLIALMSLMLMVSLMGALQYLLTSIDLRGQ